MKKYFYLVFCFLLGWISIIYFLLVAPSIQSHIEKTKVTPTSFYIYTLIDDFPKKNDLIGTDIDSIVLADLSSSQNEIKNNFVAHIVGRWNKFVQFNKQQFCLIEMQVDGSKISINHCNSYLFKRSIELSLIDSDLFFLSDDLSPDFIFKINSFDLIELYNAKNSSYINY